ncbi:MAG: hypothetical protein PHX90_05785, partial [Thermotogota bacterium]|nr:hypothetical protein [Thermotogota bacterium]
MRVMIEGSGSVSFFVNHSVFGGIQVVSEFDPVSNGLLATGVGSNALKNGHRLIFENASVEP